MPSWGIPPRQGHHEALISKKTYGIIQERLKGKTYAPMRKDLSTDFVLRGAVCCADCGTPYTSTISKGRSKHYPYYLCYQKGCQSYCKSIKREVMEKAFEEVLAQLKPANEIIKSASKMFRHQWDVYGKNIKQDEKSLLEQLKQLEEKKTTAIDRLIDTNNQSLIQVCEQRIQDIEVERLKLEERISQCSQPLSDFDKTFRTAIDFLSNPQKLWASGVYEHKRAVLRLGFSKELLYDRKLGFRTASTSSPFRLLGVLSGQESKLVGARGFTSHILCYALRASLRLFKYAPDVFVNSD